MTENVKPGSCLTQPAFADLLDWWKRVKEVLVGPAALPWYASPKFDALTPLAEFEHWLQGDGSKPGYPEAEAAMRERMLELADEVFRRRHDKRQCVAYLETALAELTTEFNEDVAETIVAAASAVAELCHHSATDEPDPYALVRAQARRLIGVVARIVRLLDGVVAESVVRCGVEEVVRLLPLEFILNRSPHAAAAARAQTVLDNNLFDLLDHTAHPKKVERPSVFPPRAGDGKTAEARPAEICPAPTTPADLDDTVQGPKSEPPTQS